MTKKINISGYNIKFVLRHRFEKTSDEIRNWDNYRMWKENRLGVWYKTYNTVSKPKDSPAILGKNGTHSTSYMFGMDLIVFKFWFDICYRPLILEI